MSQDFTVHLQATDIRAGAALVLAGLVSEGVTIVEDGYHVDRGFGNIESCDCSLLQD